MVNAAVIEPGSDYLEEVRKACDEVGSLLIFDEVITGFRIGLQGAQGRYGVTPDLATFAKAMGGGFPIACLAGRADVMDLFGDVTVPREHLSTMHGGTFNSLVPSVVASLTALKILQQPETWEYLDRIGTMLMRGIDQILDDAGVPHVVQGFPAAFYVDFNDVAPTSVRDVIEQDHTSYKAFIARLQSHGVRVHPRGVWYLSTAHTEADIEQTLEAVRECI